MSDQTPFIPGIYAKKPHERAPDFIKCKLSIKRQALLDFLLGSNEEWINAEVKETKDGEKLVVFIDTWKPNQQQATQAPPPPPFNDQSASSHDDIPFG